MSACYSSIAAGASIAAVDGSASFAPRRGASTADEFFGVLNAMGTVLFAFGGQAVIMEIQVSFVCVLCKLSWLAEGKAKSTAASSCAIIATALRCYLCSTVPRLCSVYSCCCTAAAAALHPTEPGEPPFQQRLCVRPSPAADSA